jgi:hypothetical protein
MRPLFYDIPSSCDFEDEEKVDDQAKLEARPKSV